MRELRIHIQNALSNYAPLTALIGDRVFSQGALLTAQITKPYVVHTMGNNTDEGMYDRDSFRPNRQFFQVYVHGDKGDYLMIDDVVPLVKEALIDTPVSGSVIEVRYLETSQDLEDNILQTYMKYVRFQAALSR